MNEAPPLSEFEQLFLKKLLAHFELKDEQRKELEAMKPKLLLFDFAPLAAVAEITGASVMQIRRWADANLIGVVDRYGKIEYRIADVRNVMMNPPKAGRPRKEKEGK